MALITDRSGFPKSGLALQLYRAFGSWALAVRLRGPLPGVFALLAGIGDLLTGLLALPAAIAVAAGTADGRRAATLWNIFGLADFLAITMDMITRSGSSRLPQKLTSARDRAEAISWYLAIKPSVDGSNRDQCRCGTVD